jgi:hypothetical protein
VASPPATGPFAGEEDNKRGKQADKQPTKQANTWLVGWTDWKGWKGWKGWQGTLTGWLAQGAPKVRQYGYLR